MKHTKHWDLQSALQRTRLPKKRSCEDVDITKTKYQKGAHVLNLNADALKICIRQLRTIDGVPFNTF